MYAQVHRCHIRTELPGGHYLGPSPARWPRRTSLRRIRLVDQSPTTGQQWQIADEPSVQGSTIELAQPIGSILTVDRTSPAGGGVLPSYPVELRHQPDPDGVDQHWDLVGLLETPATGVTSTGVMIRSRWSPDGAEWVLSVEAGSGGHTVGLTPLERSVPSFQRWTIVADPVPPGPA